MATSDRSEALVAAWWKERGVVAERFDKSARRQGKTPDFRLRRGDDVLGLCEVKALAADTWLEQQLANAAPGQVVGGERNDPHYNRISTQLHTAAAQLRPHGGGSTVPGVLAFVNDEESGSDYLDLIGVITGRLPMQSGWSPIILGRYALGRARDDQAAINLFLWFDVGRDPRLFFNLMESPLTATLAAAMGIDLGHLPVLGPS